ncbi:MAG: dienelactone hydrolase family protein [Rhizomicrobium sp.]
MTIKTQDVRYADGDLSCLGFLAYDDAKTGKRPGVLVVHEAFGLGEHAMNRARMIAELGYVGFAADLFGNRRQVGPDDLMTVIGGLMGDPATLRKRAKAALSTLAAQPQVDPTKLFGIGFCFGGTTVLELARDGCDLLGVVGFHSGLETKAPAQAGTMKASVLALIGADDPLVPANQRVGFEEEMRKAGADWQLMVYGNTLHSFTNPAADGSVMPGIVYNAKTDQRSWRLMAEFFEEQLKA